MFSHFYSDFSFFYLNYIRPEYSNDTIFTIALVVKTLFRGKTMDIALILSETFNFEPYMAYVWLGLFVIMVIVEFATSELVSVWFAVGRF